MDNIIEFKNATRTFGGVAAFKDVDFTLRRGEIHALLGESGAGKSTLTKVMAGVYRLTTGTMLLEGVTADFASPAESLAAGVVIIFPESTLVPTMTVAQNIYLGDEKNSPRLHGLYIKARQFLVGMGFQVDPTARVSSLGVGQKQMVEIARAVHHKARVLLFDDPTGILTPEEKRHFFTLLHRLVKQGIAVVFITHTLEDALQVSDRISILRDGELVASGATGGFTHETVVEAMMGPTPTDTRHRQGTRDLRPHGERVLTVENLSCGSIVRNACFSVFSGQVTGVFGLVDTGRPQAMAKIAAGVLKRDGLHGGDVLLAGKPVRYRVHRPVIRDGIVYVTEDPNADDFWEITKAEKIQQLVCLSQGRHPLTLASMRQVQESARVWGDRLRRRRISEKARRVTLPGDKQEKVVADQELPQGPLLIIFDEPTRSVDVEEIVEIHQLINELADQGLAVMVISSYLPEILAVSDRILIAKQGKIVEEMTISEANEERILCAAVQ